MQELLRSMAKYTKQHYQSRSDLINRGTAMRRLQKIVLAIVILAGLGAAGWIGYQRIMVERANPTVALAVDYNDALRVAALAGLTPRDVLERLKNAGASHVAITEVSLGELVETGRLLYISAGVAPADTQMSPATRKRIRKLLEAKLPRTRAQGYPARKLRMYDYYAHLLRVTPELQDIGVGYDEAVETAQQAGLKIIARPRAQFTTADSIDYAIDAARDIGADIVVFAGSRVMGYRDELGHVAKALRETGLSFGFIELAPQLGEQALARHLDYKFIRTHSISEQELEQIRPEKAINRFSLAVRERKVRLCYVRLFFTQHGYIKDNLIYVDQLTNRLRRDGFTIGSPQPFNPVDMPVWALPVLFAAIGAALMWLIQSVIGLSRLWFWVTTGAVLLIAAAAGLSGIGMFRVLAALTAALVFPTWAVLTVRLREQEQSAHHPLRTGLLDFLRISVLTAAGGLLVAACLTSDAYLMKVAQFRGVKLAELLPLVVVAGAFTARSMRNYWEVRTELGEARAELPALAAGLREALGHVVRYWHVIAVVLGLGILAILMLRSGNQPAIGVSGLEGQLRALLDQVLLVRPRSKEIFFGHPAMIVALVLIAAGTRRRLWLWLTAGTIGQVSILNTFCHLHTPLQVSLLRVGHGLWLGVLGGLVLWVIIYLGWMRRRDQPASGAG